MSKYESGEMPPDQVVKKILERPWLYGLCRIPERDELVEFLDMHWECFNWETRGSERACWDCDWVEPGELSSKHLAELVIELLRTNNKEE